ncbi:uncharacterized protein LOC108653640 [Drosophila navojoa]|uniref:uncharacterized protein LOC108653640 n=1 Tax=Drosophila navojoa TaxID=7232 RepID=UPI000846CC9F|nr:uncharacterized protein LOC108653640 [Drosophila navojoa]
MGCCYYLKHSHAHMQTGGKRAGSGESERECERVCERGRAKSYFLVTHTSAQQSQPANEQRRMPVFRYGVRARGRSSCKYVRFVAVRMRKNFVSCATTCAV